MRSLLIALVLVVAACASPQEDEHVLDTVRGADTTLIEIRRPMVIAHFPTTQAQVDSGGDVEEALTDFQYHLDGARASLTELGMAVAERYTAVIRYRVDGRVVHFAPPPDSGAAYLLLATDRPSQVHYGVLTDSDLVELARSFLATRSNP